VCNTCLYGCLHIYVLCRAVCKHVRYLFCIIYIILSFCLSLLHSILTAYTCTTFMCTIANWQLAPSRHYTHSLLLFWIYQARIILLGYLIDFRAAVRDRSIYYHSRQAHVLSSVSNVLSSMYRC